MAGEDIVITSGLDLAGLQRDFRRGIGLADQFVADLQRTLSSRDLIGDLTPAGRKAGASLARGLSSSLTGIGADLARALDLSTPIAAQGTEAAREFVAGLAAGIGAADDTLQRVAQSVDLSAGGERAGTQFTQGIARVIAAEAPALRSAMGQALVPATVATDIGRLEGVISGALARLPVVFTQAGAASGAGLIRGIAGELTNARPLLASFSAETSRAITAALTIGDVSGTGERAGRLLAVSVAAGITAEAPRVRGALATALVPSTLAPEVGRITGVFATAGQEIVGLLGDAGTTGGQALVRNMTAEVTRGAGVLKQLTAGSQIGVVVDSTSIRDAAIANRDLSASATDAATAMRAVNTAAQRIDSSRISDAAEVAALLAEAQRRAAAAVTQSTGTAVVLYRQQGDAARAAANEAAKVGDVFRAAAQGEIGALGSITDQIRAHIVLLQKYAQSVDATNVRAVAGWQSQATLIRENARALGIEGQELFKLDGFIRRTAESFRRQAAEARNAARAIAQAASPGGIGLGSAATRDLATLARQANTAKNAITATTLAGRSFDQVMGRLGPSAVAVGFGLESIARGGAAADAGIRTALRSVASFSAFFGPKGLIVAGASAALAAVIDLFSQSRDQIKETERQFQRSVEEMVKSVDTVRLQKQLRDVFLGTPTRLEDGTVDIRGGLVQLRRDLEAAKEAQRKAFAGQGGSIFKTSQEVDRLTASVAKQEAVYNSLARTILTLQSAGNDPALRQPFNITASATGAKEASDAIKRLQDDVDQLAETYRQLAPNAALQEPIVDRLTDKHEEITRLLKGQKDIASDTAVAYRTMLEQLRSIDAVMIETTRRGLPGGALPTSLNKPFEIAVTPKFDLGPNGLRLPPGTPTITLPAEFDPSALNDSLRAAIRGFQSSQQNEIFAKIFGTRQQVAQATKFVDTQTQNLTRTFKAAIAAELASADADDVKAKKIGVIVESARALGRELGTDARIAQSFSTAMADVANAAFAVGDVARSIGGVSDEALQAFTNVGRLAGALGELSQIKLTGQGGFFSSFEGFLKGIPVVGSVISAAVDAYRSVIGTLSGKFTADANAQILKENTAALKTLALRVGGFDDTIGGLLSTATAIDTSKILATRTGSSFQRGFKDVENLDAEFRAAGLSVFELKKRAEQLGITITDAKGRISASGLRDLAEASRLAVLELVTFADTLKDQTFLADARREIFDTNDAATVGKDWLEQLKKFAPELFTKFFAGADVATKEGRARFEQGIRDVFDLAALNKLPPELIKMFGSAEAFVEFLLGADRALDDLTDTTSQLNSEMVNVVQGFRDFNLDRAVFRAQDQRNTVPTLPPRPSPPSVPVAASTTSVGSLVFSPTIVLRDVGDKNITQLSSELVAELKRKANAIPNPIVQATVNALPA